jgi:hypothetical protein
VVGIHHLPDKDKRKARRQMRAEHKIKRNYKRGVNLAEDNEVEVREEVEGWTGDVD